MKQEQTKLKTRKQPIKSKRTPELTPGVFLKYNTRAHKTLLYAKFKNHKPFTASDYHDFTIDKPTLKRVDEAIRYLSKIGYLNKTPHPNPAIRTLKYVYTITLSGEHALHVIQNNEMDRRHKKVEVQNGKNAIKRWGTEE